MSQLFKALFTVSSCYNPNILEYSYLSYGREKGGIKKSCGMTYCDFDIFFNLALNA